MAPPLCGPHCTELSTNPYSVQIPYAGVIQHLHSFIGEVWNSLPLSVFPPAFNLTSFRTLLHTELTSFSQPSLLHFICSADRLFPLYLFSPLSCRGTSFTIYKSFCHQPNVKDNNNKKKKKMSLFPWGVRCRRHWLCAPGFSAMCLLQMMTASSRVFLYKFKIF